MAVQDAALRLRFIPNMPNIKRLKRTEDMQIYLGIRAEAGAEKARQIAPVDTGDYRNGITGQAGIDNFTAIGRISAADWKSGFIEFGTYKWPAHATLRLGAEASGLRVKGGRKLRWRPRIEGGWY